MADTWMSQHLTLGRFWLVVDVPRGPFMGCHVAPCGWLVVYVKFYGFNRGHTHESAGSQMRGVWIGPSPQTSVPPNNHCQRDQELSTFWAREVSLLSPWSCTHAP
jgi:hypothetical protein